MQNSKDPQHLDTYYNKRHGAEKISKTLSLVNRPLAKDALSTFLTIIPEK
jgi:hypothetical protein